MAETLGDGEFWLPSEFLTDDILLDKENIKRNGFDADLFIPSLFPSDFSSLCSSLSSPVESVVSSTETESDEELTAGLTRRFSRSALKERTGIGYASQNFEKLPSSGSPQSTLNAVGSWSEKRMPLPQPISPFTSGNDAWDLIYEAAGQIARLKVNAELAGRNTGVLFPSRRNGLAAVNFLPSVKDPDSEICQNQALSHLLQSSRHHQMRHEELLKRQGLSVWRGHTKERRVYHHQASQCHVPATCGVSTAGGGGGFFGNGRCSRPPRLCQSVWPAIQGESQYGRTYNNQQRVGSGMRAGDGGIPKRECAGTGVFLPRRYENPADSRRKSGGSTALLPARVVQTHNKNFADYGNSTCHPQTQCQQRLNGSLIPDCELLMGRGGNAMSAQQPRRSIRPHLAMSHEIRLPQEWTY